MRIVMPRGVTLRGKVVDASGAPVPNVALKADSHIREDSYSRKAATTDDHGGFVLRGVAKAPTVIRVLSTSTGQKVKLEKAVEGDEEGLTIRLAPMQLTATPKSQDVLGMKLTDVSPALKEAYEIYQDRGAVILDPGPDSDRLDIGRLAKGYTFWMVGSERIGGVREFVERLLKESTGAEGDPQPVRVVYTYVGAEADGTNTQYLKLTKADVDQLKAVLKTLE